MKKIFVVITIIFLSCNNQDGLYFDLVKGESEIFPREGKSFNFYTIKRKKDNSLISYPLKMNDVPSEVKLGMIEELLNYENNISICAYPVMGYDKDRSQMYLGDLKDYSIQVEALFLINQIYFDYPFKYSPLPILVDIKTGEEESIDGKIIKSAFESYKNWFRIIKNKGISKAKEDGEYPLKNSNISWIYSIRSNGPD